MSGAAAFPRVATEGAGFERGSQLGQQAGDRILGSLALYKDVFAHYTGMNWDEVRRRAGAYQAPIEEYDGELIPEMEGIAEAVGIKPADVLAINARTEIMYGLSDNVAAECSAFGARGAATVAGDVIIGQNWDWIPPSRSNCIVHEARLPDGLAFVTFVEAGLMAKIGFNSAGVGLVTNLLVTDEDRGRVGVPFHVILRKVLMSASFEDAVDAIVGADRASSANYLVGSSDGMMVDIEARPGGVGTVNRIEPTSDLLHHTNNFCNPMADATDRGRELLPDSPARDARMAVRLEERRGRLDVDTAIEMLNDHDGYPSALCRHADEALHPLERVVTVGSAVLELSAGRLHLADGPPCEAEHYTPIVPEFAQGAKAAYAPSN